MSFRESTRAYPACDTFFVENDDELQSSSRTNSRDYVKLIARQRQDMIAEELSSQARNEYLDDIIAHLKFMEESTLPDVASIDVQEEIQWFMRPYLLDFLVEAHSAFQLLPETLFLAVNLLDRYCSKRVVYKGHYQLVGCASLLIAAKYGDRKDRVPTIRELKAMCCGQYEEHFFTQMEWHVLNTLDWIVGHPTVDSFLQIATVDTYVDFEAEHMASYICEVALYHKEFVSAKPSVLASASLALARGILGRSELPDQTWGTDENLTMINLSMQLHRPSQVLSRKYASPHLSRVATTLEAFLAQQAAVARNSAPMTPPCEVAIQQKPIAANEGNIYTTPHKPQHGQNPLNGYMTPPRTPEGEYFVPGDEYRMYHTQAQRRPITPTPSNHHNPYCTTQQYPSYRHETTY